MQGIIIFIKIIIGAGLLGSGILICCLVDAEFREVTEQKKGIAAAASAGIYLLSALVLKGEPASGLPDAAVFTAVWELLDSLFWSSLALAAYSDYCTMRVWDFIHLPAAAAGVLQGIMCMFTPIFTLQMLLDLILFAGLQWVFIRVMFRGKYGEADGLAFFMCALHMAATGGTFLQYLVHMAAAYLLFGTVQILKGNVNRKGNLKTPMPLIPYIAAAMLIYG